MKQRLLIAFLLLFQAINLLAQIDSSHFYKFKEPPRLGVKQTLRIHYDGDNLLMSLTIQGKDTCTYLKGTNSDLQQRITNWYVLGYVYHNSERHILSNSTSTSEIRKKGNEVKYVYQLNPIPIVIDGLDSINFRLADYEIDSVVFSYQGKEPLAYSKPTALVFTHDTLIWQKENLLHTEDTLSFKVFFEGSNKGIFAQSKFTLQDKNRRTDMFDVLKSLLFVIPFWFLLFLLLTQKEAFGSNIELANRFIKWIPVLSGFYFVIFFSDIFSPFDQTEIGMTMQDGSDKIARNRMIFLAGSILLLLIQFICFRKAKNPIAVFFKKLLMVIAWSGIVLVLLGLINFIAELIFYHTDRMNFGDSLQLQIRMNYLAFIGTLGGLFILFCFYKLFSFNKRYMFVTCGFLIFFIIMRIVFFFPEPPPPPDSHRMIARAFLSTVFLVEYELLLALPGIALLMILDKVSDHSLKKTILFSTGAFVFLFCIYGTTALFDSFINIPVTLIFAFLLSKYFLLSNLKQKIDLLKVEKQLFALDNLDRKVFTKIFELRQFEKLKEKYKEKLLKGELLPAEFDKANSDLETKINESVSAGIDRLMIQQRMQFPLFENKLKNTERATGFGLLISFLFLLLYYRVFPLNYLTESRSTDYVVFDLLFYVLIPCFTFVAASFSLGFFFIYIKGDSGWKKGFYIGLVMAFAKLPYQYLISGKLTLMFFLVPFMREILIMTLIGFLAFDYSTIKKIYGKDFSLKHLAQIEGWQNLAWFASILLSAIGAAIIAWFSGNISSILENVTK